MTIKSLRHYQLIEQGILSRLRLEWLASGSELSFDEFIKQEPKSPLTTYRVVSGEPVFILNSHC